MIPMMGVGTSPWLGGGAPAFQPPAPSYQPGQFTQQAIQMAGGNHWTPYAPVAPPPAPPGSSSSGGGFNLSSLLPYLAAAGAAGYAGNKGYLGSTVQGALGKAGGYLKGLLGGGSSGADALTGVDAAGGFGSAPGIGTVVGNNPLLWGGASAADLAGAGASAMPALTAADIAGSAGIGGDAAIAASLQGSADAGIAGLGADAGAAGADAAAGGMGSMLGTLGTVAPYLAAAAALGYGVSRVAGNPGAQEAKPWQGFTSAYNSNPTAALSGLNPSSAYQDLASVMSAENNSPGHSQPIEQVFGRMGEQNLMDQMTAQINSQIAAGKIARNATPQQIYQQVVSPWLASKNASIANQYTSKGQAEAPALQADLTSLIGDWQNGSLNANSRVGSGGQTISGLQAFGANPTQVASAMPMAAPAMRTPGLIGRVAGRGMFG